MIWWHVTVRHLRFCSTWVLLAHVSWRENQQHGWQTSVASNFSLRFSSSALRYSLSQTKGNFRLVLIFCSVCVYHVVMKVQYYKFINIQTAEWIQFLVAFDKTSIITLLCSLFTGMKLTNEHLVLSKTILQSEWLVFGHCVSTFTN